VKRLDRDRHVFGQAAGHGEANVRVALVGPSVVQAELIQTFETAGAGPAADVHLDSDAIARMDLVNPLAEFYNLPTELMARDMWKRRSWKQTREDFLVGPADRRRLDPH
jgi:hypothetical protein